MTKSASEWPTGVIERKDNFSQKTVLGVIGNPSKPPNVVEGNPDEWYAAQRNVSAGPKFGETFTKKFSWGNVETTKKFYYWQSNLDGKFYKTDPSLAAGYNPGRSSDRQISLSAFEKTSWLGLAFGGGGQGSYKVAYQLWVKKGSSGISTESITDAYVRRGGAFTSTTGTEWFVPYDDIRGNVQHRYAPRKIGAIYRSAEEQITFRASLTPEQVAAGFAAGIDWATASWPININGWPPTVADIISAAAAINGPLNFGGGGPGGGPGRRNRGRDGGDASVPDLPIPAITITTRMPKGYAGRAVGGTARPQMVQRYQTEGAKYADETFIFRYIPQGIKYSGLGSNWVEIPRAEDIPFVDWASWQLMKVSFSFVIAADRTESGGAVVPDGLDISVDDQIEKLRKMAQRKVPVTLVNFDDMLTFQLRRGEQSRKGTNIYVGEDEKRIRTTQPNMEFVIQDLSVTATRRTSQQQVGGKDKDGLRSSSMMSLISVAQCEITLTETPVETVGIIALPEITTPGLPPSKKKPPGSSSQKYAYITDIMASPSSAYNSYTPNDNIPNT